MLRITDTYELSGWRPQAMDMPRLLTRSCPCCRTELVDIAGLYVPGPYQYNMPWTIGECVSCGYLGYTLRPTNEWFESFYASDWDAAGQEASVDLSKCAVHPITRFIPQIAKPGASVCDVGCGFGIAAWQLKQMGHPVRGVEKSQHRADVANAHGVRTVKELSQIGKFDVITAHHVLEHSVNPYAFIAEIAEHQDEGGILYLSVPNQVGEPSMGCLLFLPHLHSFQFGSLCNLANRHGYALHAWNLSGFNLEVAFVKGGGGRQAVLNVESAVVKLSRAIHANGQGPLLSWCGNYSDAWFTDCERFAGWKRNHWKPRAVRAERVKGPGRFPVELEVPCLFVK